MAKYFYYVAALIVGLLLTLVVIIQYIKLRTINSWICGNIHVHQPQKISGQVNCLNIELHK